MKPRGYNHGRVIRRTLIIAAYLFLTGAATANVTGVSKISGWIDESRTDGIYKFVATAKSDRDAHVRYQLEARRIGASGKSTTGQSGQAQLRPGIPQRLSSTSLSIADGDDYCVKLLIYSNDAVVGKDLKSSAHDKGCAE